MHHEQDILKMGGLRKKMPQTFLVFAVGWLAICGIPPFSGFFSKDEVLWVAYGSQHGSVALYIVAAVTAMMTAFYMTRLVSLTFFGEARFEDGHEGHSVHESPWVMTVPLMILAVLSALGGFMGIPHQSWLAHWLEPVIPAHHELREGVDASMEWMLMGVSVASAVIMITVALQLYKSIRKPEQLKIQFAALHRLLSMKWYVDEIYAVVIVQPLRLISGALWKFFDVGVIDRIVVGTGRVTHFTGQAVRVVQTGSIQFYAFIFLLGLAIAVGAMIYGMA
jgi:NADH-quinone oxidoreductase subunit L